MFHSPECPYCDVMMPYFVNFTQEFRNVGVFALINIATNPWTTERYRTQITPTFKSFCCGRPVCEQVGEIDPSMLKNTVEKTIALVEEYIRKSIPIGQSITGYQ